MNNGYNLVKIGDFLELKKERYDISYNLEYKQVKVKLWGKGLVIRKNILGQNLSGKQNLVHSGQFIISKIDARHGAYGIVPQELDNSIVSTDFPTFQINGSLITPDFLFFLSRSTYFINLCRKSSEGSTNRVRLRINKFLDTPLFLPQLSQQREMVSLFKKCEEKILLLKKTILFNEKQYDDVLGSYFKQIISDSKYMPMPDVAPITRRPVELDLNEKYYELGIRSFGKGTFHKPYILGSQIGSKKIFWIKPGDLLFNNVFAWEGAIAVAQDRDENRVGSHRFIACKTKESLVLPDLLCYYFLTKEGLEKILKASPGGAGRNRTLGVKKLEKIIVPVPDYYKQNSFVILLLKIKEQKNITAKQILLIDDILMSVINSKLQSCFLN